MINSNRKCVFPYSKEMKEMTEILQETEDLRPQHIYDTLDPAGEQEDMDDQDAMEPIDRTQLPSEVNEGHFPEQVKYKPIDVECEEKMLTMAQSMSPEQMIGFIMLIHYCKTIAALGPSDTTLEPPRIIIHGGGDTVVYIVVLLW